MARQTTAVAARRRRGRPKTPPVSRLRAPDGMAPEHWQVALRRQFGREQDFRLDNLGAEPLFSDYRVTNPKSGGVYRVSIRGAAPGDNRCSCADFATNELGTCKHIEFVLAKLERRRGAKAALRRGFAPAFSEVWLQYGAERSVRLRPGGDCPRPLLAAARALFEEADGWRLPVSRFDRLDGFIERARQCRHELCVHDDVPRLIAQARAAEERRRRLAALYPQGTASPALRNLLRTPLFPYQAEGALFAAAAGRSLIADEMGLGKTIQAIAAAELWQRHFDAQRVLVVCPTSLKHQWARELDRFTGRAALIVEGSATERARQYAAPDACKIVSYDSLTRDLELANAWRADVLIVDEAQRIKNWDTQAARALKRLDTRYAVVLTGTPLENRLEELLSVVQLVDRHRLGPTWRFLHEHQLRDDSGRVTGYRRLDRIGETLAPILIRRRKREVLEQLPERRDRNLFVPLTATQRALHDEQADIVARIVARWRRYKHLSAADQKRLQAALQRMRMVCNSSYLLDPASNEGTKLPELMAWLDARLGEADAKVVVFSAWLGTHELIARELKARDVGHVQFNGGIPARERGALVDRFRDDAGCRVFLSTDAGGLGLNLQHAAALIVNMDLPWNPAVLEQRIGRVFRLGQRRRVEVLNFIAERSIEENMLGVLKFKRSLFQGALEGGAGEVRLEGTRLSRFMQSVDALTNPAAAPPDGAETAKPAAAVSRQVTPVSGDIDAIPAVPRTNGDAAAAAGGLPGTDPQATGIESQTGSEPTAAFMIAQSPSAATVPAAALQPLLQFAGSWLTELAAAVARPEASPLVERDPVSGRSMLRLPLPEPDLLRRLADVVQSLQR